MVNTAPYSEALDRFAGQAIVTVATGATCAYLGDERNLREFLIADETARRLRAAGHTVFSLLIDDSLDPLNFRQLRVAVNKDEGLIDRFQSWCGKPIAHLPDPWECHDSFAAHFEHELLGRLHHLGCHPTLVSTASLYERGVYAPYVRIVMERYDEILRFLGERFVGYQPEKLFWVLCPHCGYIDETRIEGIERGCVRAHCHRCDNTTVAPFDALRGKLNWKLDCAARWAIFKVDAEPFNKAYLDPQAGSYYVSRALCQEFFGGGDVLPLHYGLVKMDKALGCTLLESLPSCTLRALFVERPCSDITLTRDLVVTSASRYEVLPGLSYLDFVKQLLPMWLLKPNGLTSGQRELVASGVAFAKHFLQTEARLHLPTREQLEDAPPPVLRAVHSVLTEVIRLRRSGGLCPDEFQAAVKPILNGLGGQKKAALHRLRVIVSQEQGLPVGRFLNLLPLDYLRMVECLLELYLNSATLATDQDIAELAA